MWQKEQNLFPTIDSVVTNKYDIHDLWAWQSAGLPMHQVIVLLEGSLRLWNV